MILRDKTAMAQHPKEGVGCSTSLLLLSNVVQVVAAYIYLEDLSDSKFATDAGVIFFLSTPLWAAAVSVVCAKLIKHHTAPRYVIATTIITHTVVLLCLCAVVIKYSATGPSRQQKSATYGWRKCSGSLCQQPLIGAARATRATPRA